MSYRNTIGCWIRCASEISCFVDPEGGVLATGERIHSFLSHGWNMNLESIEFCNTYITQPLFNNPQVGFLIAIDTRNHMHDIATNTFPDLPPDFSYVFLQENEAYFKNSDMRGLDEEIGDLDAFIKDTEGMIVSELEEDILDCESELRSTFEAFAILDCLIAFASCAIDLNFVRPVIIESGGDGDSSANDGIFIENGRHPLQELIVDNDFIPNDTHIDQSRRINVVTGPNFSGKSCYTRQVGILVYMAHIGCFLPCDSARISITDQILARISSVETCAVPQSSFQLDLTQMAAILNRSTSKSLVLVDEFGKVRRSVMQCDEWGTFILERRNRRFLTFAKLAGNFSCIRNCCIDCSLEETNDDQMQSHLYHAFLRDLFSQAACGWHGQCESFAYGRSHSRVREW